MNCSDSTESREFVKSAMLPTPDTSSPVDVPGREGRTALLAVCTGLVFLMVPSFSFFYGGLVGQHQAGHTMMIGILGACVSVFQWVFWGYSLSHAIGNPFIGDLSKFFYMNMEPWPDFTVSEITFATFQMSFAAVTMSLISGAFANRVTAMAWMWFCFFWQTIVYSITSHWIWAKGGWLRELGALDFAGIEHYSTYWRDSLNQQEE